MGRKELSYEKEFQGFEAGTKRVDNESSTNKRLGPMNVNQRTECRPWPRHLRGRGRLLAGEVWGILGSVFMDGALGLIDERTFYVGNTVCRGITVGGEILALAPAAPYKIGSGQRTFCGGRKVGGGDDLPERGLRH